MPVESVQNIVRQQTQRHLDRIDIAILEYIERAPKAVSMEDVEVDVHCPAGERMGEYWRAGLIVATREGSGRYVVTKRCHLLLNAMRNKLGVEDLASVWRRGRERPRPRPPEAAPSVDELDIMSLVGDVDLSGEADPEAEARQPARPLTKEDLDDADTFGHIDGGDDEDEEEEDDGEPVDLIEDVGDADDEEDPDVPAGEVASTSELASSAVREAMERVGGRAAAPAPAARQKSARGGSAGAQRGAAKAERRAGRASPSARRGSAKGPRR